MKKGTSETICLHPKPTAPASSWWASPYPDRASWYAAASQEATRLMASKVPAAAYDCATGRFGDYWKKPKPDERPYVADDVELVA